MQTSASDEIRRVLDAKTPEELFGDNSARARIRYRRLARVVHPDANDGSADAHDAMRRLNMLYDAYVRNMSPADAGGSVRPREVTRGTRYVVLEEGASWLVVDRVAGTTHSMGDARRLAWFSSGTPLCALGISSRKSIAQAHGTHAAYVCDVPRSMGGQAIMLESLVWHLPGNRLHPRDAAWLTKRVLFLAFAMEQVKLRFDGIDPCSCLAVSPSQHMLCVVAPWHLAQTARTTVAEQRAVTTSWLRCAKPMLGGDARSRRIRRFLEGTVVDAVTESHVLLNEYDAMLEEVFGPPAYHEMEVF